MLFLISSGTIALIIPVAILTRIVGITGSTGFSRGAVLIFGWCILNQIRILTKTIVDVRVITAVEGCKITGIIIISGIIVDVIISR